ncbi:hypothetical protein F2Q70_00029151 [Brassica cretica]|uniref:At2g35280-like TPR domain-containing protein n=1 Tax=Brassica cretica TaxID=69181 RepID=A0A8S9FIC4_BRACR|nr:hypothetical protein F2Q70_00029151 [Brassica cretica]
MANFNLASLPPSTLHKILSKVATTSIRDFGSARVAFSGSNAVGREDHFYKSVVFIFLNDWIYEVNVVRTFKLKCYQLGNPEAIYLRGMYEYFILYLLDEGREKIHLAGDRGCMLAKYVDVGHSLAIGVTINLMFMYLLGRIDRNVSYDCWCSAIIEPVFVVSIDGSRTRWKCDRCFWQCATWDFCNEIHLTACDWPIED